MTEQIQEIYYDIEDIQSEVLNLLNAIEELKKAIEDIDYTEEYHKIMGKLYDVELHATILNDNVKECIKKVEKLLKEND